MTFQTSFHLQHCLMTGIKAGESEGFFGNECYIDSVKSLMWTVFPSNLIRYFHVSLGSRFFPRPNRPHFIASLSKGMRLVGP